MKRYLLIIVFAVYAIGVSYRMYQLRYASFQNIIKKNIEALANGEPPSESEKSEICWNDLEYDKSKGDVSTTRYCGTCSEVPYTHRVDQSICKIKKN